MLVNGRFGSNIVIDLDINQMAVGPEHDSFLIPWYSIYKNWYLYEIYTALLDIR